jgi:hypothetical protein
VKEHEDAKPKTSRCDRWHSDQVWTLLSKYAQCRALHAPSRMLCRHEVSLLRICGAAYGNWSACVLSAQHFHANFSTTAKFHFAVCETARFAEKHYTVGMAGNHVVEVAHARFNQYRRTFCSVQNKPAQMGLCARASWNASNPPVPETKKDCLGERNARQGLTPRKKRQQKRKRQRSGASGEIPWYFTVFWTVNRLMSHCIIQFM